jgi:hypothetical protein
MSLKRQRTKKMSKFLICCVSVVPEELVFTKYCSQKLVFSKKILCTKMKSH